jgi:hypothetical protein
MSTSSFIVLMKIIILSVYKEAWNHVVVPPNLDEEPFLSAHGSIHYKAQSLG